MSMLPLARLYLPGFPQDVEIRIQHGFDLEFFVVVARASSIDFRTRWKSPVIIIAPLDEYVSERECFSPEALMTYLYLLVLRFLTLVRPEVVVITTGAYAFGVIYYNRYQVLVCGYSVLIIMR